jgi:hypothetical protein
VILGSRHVFDVPYGYAGRAVLFSLLAGGVTWWLAHRRRGTVRATLPWAAGTAMIAGAIFVVLPLSFALLFTTRWTERRVEHARGVGEIQILPFSGVPFQWLSDDVVVYQTYRGTTTVSLTAGVIREDVDPSITPSTDRTRATFDTFPVGSRFGPWEVVNKHGVGGAFAADDSGDVKCEGPLVSPDGSRLACTYRVTDRWAESSETSAAVIRLR